MLPLQQDKTSKQKPATSSVISGQFKNWFWPSINDYDQAKKVSRQGVIAAISGGIITCGFIILGAHYLGGFVEAVFTLFIGYGIYKMYRFAPILGLCYYIYGRVEFIKQWVSIPWLGFAVMIALTLMYINSIRGIFAYHKFKEVEAKQAARDCGAEGDVNTRKL